MSLLLKLGVSNPIEMIPAISSIAIQIVRPNYGAISKLIHLSAVSEAARKGTREKARKNKVKKEVQKVGFIPHNLRDKKIAVSKVSKHVDDSWKRPHPPYDVYHGRFYRWKVYSVDEAIECHRETHHPTIYNVPDAPINAHIEILTNGEKATRFVDNFSRVAQIPHQFDHGETRNILVFTKDPEQYEDVRAAGASLVGGLDIIKDVQTGQLLLSDYRYIIAHTNILPDLVQLRGLMKRNFPNPKSETLGVNLTEMVERFANGISYTLVKDEQQKDFGLITACFGKLDMDKTHLEENLVALLKDIDSVRPKREGKFITRVILKSPPSREQLKIDPFVYIPEKYSGKGRKSKSEDKVEDVDDDDEEKEAAAN